MKRSQADILKYVALPTLLVASFGIFMTALVQRIDDDARLNDADTLAENIGAQIATGFSVAESDLRGLAGLWIGSENVTAEEFGRYAAAVYDPEAPLIALEWVDTGNVVRMVYPLEGENLKAVDFDNNKFPNRLAPILLAKETRVTNATDPLFLVQGFPGVILYQPIYRGDEYLGMAVGVARLSSVMHGSARLSGAKTDVAVTVGTITVNADGTAIYANGKRVTAPGGASVDDPEAPRVNGGLRGTYTFEVAGRQWTVHVDPRTSGLSQTASVIALITFAITVLSAFYLLTLQRVRAKLEETVSREHDFAALVSHQLRAPLTELNWMVDVVEDPKSSDEERAATLKDMRHIVRQGVRTVAGLLTISRVERGVLQVKKDDVPVATIVDDALAPLRDDAKEKRMSFHLDVPPGLTAATDADKAIEALRNVIDNAVKYGPSGSTVDIAALKTGDVVTVTVRDRGPGIPSDVGAAIFDKASAFAKKGTTEGAGLGLFVTKTLLDLLGGTIRYDTGPSGTTFVITLPANAAKRGKA